MRPAPAPSNGGHCRGGSSSGYPADTYLREAARDRAAGSGGGSLQATAGPGGQLGRVPGELEGPCAPAGVPVLPQRVRCGVGGTAQMAWTESWFAVGGDERLRVVEEGSSPLLVLEPGAFAVYCTSPDVHVVAVVGRGTEVLCCRGESASGDREPRVENVTQERE